MQFSKPKVVGNSAPRLNVYSRKIGQQFKEKWAAFFGPMPASDASNFAASFPSKSLADKIWRN